LKINTLHRGSSLDIGRDKHLFLACYQGLRTLVGEVSCK